MGTPMIRLKKIAKTAFAASVLWSRFGIGNINLKASRNVAVYPGLGLVYNRVKKNANTTVVLLLRGMESGVVESRKAAKSNSQNFLELSFAEISDLRNYCFFVVVRNPYSRVLSAFLNKFQGESYKQLHGTFDLTPDGFIAFVEWLKDGGLNKNAHWDLQTKLMFLPLAKYDVVVRFENFEAEMLSLLKSKHLQPPEGRLGGLYPADVNKKTSSDSLLQSFYTPRLADMVADLYAKDFDELGYSRAFPEAVSRDTTRV